MINIIFRFQNKKDTNPKFKYRGLRRHPSEAGLHKCECMWEIMQSLLPLCFLQWSFSAGKHGVRGHLLLPWQWFWSVVDWTIQKRGSSASPHFQVPISFLYQPLLLPQLLASILLAGKKMGWTRNTCRNIPVPTTLPIISGKCWVVAGVRALEDSVLSKCHVLS